VLPWLPMFVWLTFLPRLHWLSKVPVSQRLLRFAAFVNLGFHCYHVSLVTSLCECARLWLSEHFLFCYCRGCCCCFCFCFWRANPQWARASSFTRFLDHTKRRTTVGRIPLDEWSARRRDLYLTTHTTLTTDKYPCPGGFRTHNLSKRAAPDLRLRLRGHWDRLTVEVHWLILL